MGQTRRFRDVRRTSGLPRTADIFGPGGHFAFVPKAERQDTVVSPLKVAVSVDWAPAASSAQPLPALVFCPVRRKDDEHFVRTAIAAIRYFLDQDHSVRARSFADILDEHVGDAMHDLFLLSLRQRGLRHFDVSKGHRTSP